MAKKTRVDGRGKAHEPGMSRRARIGASLMAALFVTAAWWVLTRPSGPASSTDVPAPTPQSDVGAPARPAAAPDALRGRWQRADGGYVLEIRSVRPDGALDARYFNPAPINVSQARVTTTGGVLQVFVELRDVNYPGSTYTLAYDPANDLLGGEYFQAAQQQRYDVAFARQR